MNTVTDTERALLAAIRAHPDEDTPRLVYADLLQEQGDDDRAEFVRVQCELSHPVPMTWAHSDGAICTCSRCVLRDRESALLAANRERWLRVPCPKCDESGYLVTKRNGVPTRWRCYNCEDGDTGGLTWYDDDRHPTVFRRGFPHELCGYRLDDVIEPSSATTLTQVAERRVTLVPTKWAIRVLTHHPTVTRIPLVDRVPLERNGVWLWFNDDGAEPVEGVWEPVPHWVPQVLWDRLDTDPLSNGYPNLKGFGSERLADDALAVAGVAVIRDHIRKNPRPPQE